MNINHWKEFLSVARTHNITRSAENLHMTQQALSRNLAQLEDELGIKLYDRSTEGTLLSSVGRKILPVVEKMVASYDNSLDMVYTIIHDSTVDFPIAFEHNVLLNGFPPDLLTRVGNYRVKAYLAHDYKICIEHVLSGRASCAFMHKQDDLKGLSYYPVIRRRHDVIMSKNHYLANRKELYIEDLKNVNHSWLSINSSMFDQYFKLCMEHGFYPRITSEYPTAELQHKMLASGQEITVGGGYIFTSSESDLVRIPLNCGDKYLTETGFVYDSKRKDAAFLESYFTTVKKFYE